MDEEAGKMTDTALPTVVTAEEWQVARDELLAAEKAATRSLDALAARRRRLPMVRFATEYRFDSPSGPRTLLDLFEGRDQLAAYQFMDVGPDGYCPGCTAFTNNVADLGDLAGAGVSWVTVSDMPLPQISRYASRSSRASGSAPAATAPQPPAPPSTARPPRRG